MTIIKGIIEFYMQNVILNTALIIGALALIWFLWTYRKLEVMALAASIKAETVAYLKGGQKLDFAINWLTKQSFYKNSLFRFIPVKWIKGLINILFKWNKDTIESK